jgi:hypothetical protein
MADIKGTVIECAPEEEHLLLRLGWAVIAQWDALSEDARKRLVRQAVLTIGNKPEFEPVQMQQQMEEFLREHTDYGE